MTDTYWEVSVTANDETSEGFSDFLFSEGALGLLVEDVPDDPRRILIRASFPRSVPIEHTVQRLRSYQDSLRALSFSDVTDWIEVREFPLLDWARISADQFEPIDVGKRFTVAPPSHPGPFPADRLLIRITPAMAFGTGYSPTTRMCLEGLEEFLGQWKESRGPLVLDVGTGTGILAIAAAGLDARRIVAVDTDPLACRAARENLALHTWADRIQIVHGTVETLAAASRFDLILANLETKILLPLFSAFAALLAPAGQLVVGGITLEEEAAIRPAIGGASLRIIRCSSEEGWLCLTVARGGEPENR